MIASDSLSRALWQQYVDENQRAHADYVARYGVRATTEDYRAAAIWGREQKARDRALRQRRAAA